MRQTLLLAAFLCLSRGIAAAPFYLYENADNMQNRQEASGVVALGLEKDSAGCEKKCVAQLGADPTTGCTSFTFYHNNYNNKDVAGRCFGDTTGSWKPYYSTCSPDTMYVWGNVTSGQNNPDAYQTQCSDPADCSYNGVCSGGTCACHPQWMGKNCAQLNLVATDKGAGLQSHNAGGRVSSWGGSVIRGDDGTYHMWAAEMTNNTGIVVWMSNSQIRHAISRTGPTGPYEPQDIAFGVWGHEPTAARAPTGEYVLFWTAKFGDDVPCSHQQCGHGNNGDTVVDDQYCLPDTKCVYRPDLTTYMSYSKDPAGPWSAPVLVPKGAFGDGDTNLAAIIRADGSLLGLGRPPWIWRAADWRNLSTYSVEQVDATVIGEDPFLYVDAYNSSVLHGLSHSGGWESTGAHVWSTDGGKTWGRHEDMRAYGSLMLYTDGTFRSLSRRERPHLVFDEHGVPLALTNGVTDTWPCTFPENCPHDYCYTNLQKLNQKSRHQDLAKVLV